LDLPTETQDYVPRLLALSSIFANPGNYGLKLRPVKNEPYFIKVAIDREVDIEHLLNKDLQTIAKLANFDPEEFSSLNAAYLKTTLTERKPFNFLMPISKANHLHKSLGYLAQSTKQLEHQVLPNTPETAMPDIINKSKFQMPWLALTLGEERFWPFSKELTTFDIKPKSSEIEKTVASKTDYWEVHYLDKDETLKSLAEHHGISEEKLRQTNKIKNKQAVLLGHRLLIPLPQVTSIPTKSTKSSVLYKGTYRFNPFISQI
jgi:LysM repeat protein